MGEESYETMDRRSEVSRVICAAIGIVNTDDGPHILSNSIY